MRNYSLELRNFFSSAKERGHELEMSGLGSDSIGNHKRPHLARQNVGIPPFDLPPASAICPCDQFRKPHSWPTVRTSFLAARPALGCWPGDERCVSVRKCAGDLFLRPVQETAQLANCADFLLGGEAGVGLLAGG